MRLRVLCFSALILPLLSNCGSEDDSGDVSMSGANAGPGMPSAGPSGTAGAPTTPVVPVIPPPPPAEGAAMPGQGEMPVAGGSNTGVTPTPTPGAGTPAPVGDTAAPPMTPVAGMMPAPIDGMTAADGMSGEAAPGGEGSGAESMTGGEAMTDPAMPAEEMPAEEMPAAEPTAGASLADYNPDFKEFVGEDCDLPEPTLLASPDHSLPDPFLMPDGSRMTSVSQWACQRAWLKKNLEAFVFGEKPGRPDTVTGTVSASSINVHVEHGGSSADFSVSVSLPQGASGPVPGMFQSGGSGVPTNTLGGLGVAAISYNDGDLERAYSAIYGNAPTNQIQWAWAISRVVDVLVDQRDAGANDIIDPTALATTGCSRSGKSAFTVGAFDERIALGIPMESGTGGLGSYRVVADDDLGPNGGEDPEQVGEACSSNWLGRDVCSNTDSVPADAHFVVALYAPRGFTTLDNNRIGHLGPVAQYTAAAAGAEVFKALGVESHIGYHGGNDTDPHNHCSYNQSQGATVEAAVVGFLTKEAEPANFMEPKLKNANDQAVNFDLANYINWDTPTLE